MSTFGCPARSMPANWDPPAPAWSTRFESGPKTLVAALFTTEGDAEAREAQVARLDAWFASDDGPLRVERAEHPGRSGERASLTLAYWRDPDAHRAWLGQGFEAWWQEPARLSDPAGHAIEVMTIPVERQETIFGQAEQVGAAVLTPTVIGPVREHLYWGSMRDRIAASATDCLASPYGDTLPRLGTTATRGRRLRVVAPDNLCVIRSGQNWAGCDPKERERYDRTVRPALHAGMRYLRENPEESGCLDMRFAHEIGTDGPLERAFGLGFFLSLAHLEAWAAHHPTHLAIFERMVDLATTSGDALGLRLWHEVFVLPGAGQRFEYVNCPPGTGLLPYFAATEM